MDLHKFHKAAMSQIYEAAAFSSEYFYFFYLFLTFFLYIAAPVPLGFLFFLPIFDFYFNIVGPKYCRRPVLLGYFMNERLEIYGFP